MSLFWHLDRSWPPPPMSKIINIFFKWRLAFRAQFFSSFLCNSAIFIWLKGQVLFISIHLFVWNCRQTKRENNEFFRLLILIFCIESPPCVQAVYILKFNLLIILDGRNRKIAFKLFFHYFAPQSTCRKKSDIYFCCRPFNILLLATTPQTIKMLSTLDWSWVECWGEAREGGREARLHYGLNSI